MAEKLREYKRRIDAEWRKNERNKNKLIKKIKEYELLDERCKEEIEKEILKNFLEKEKDEKGEEYENVVNLIKDSDKKYEVLEQLKKNLKLKEEEKAQKEEKIVGNRLDRVDKTTIMKQKADLENLVKERENLGKEIEEIKKEISDMEEEIRDMEEEYGENSDVKEVEEEESIEDKEVASKKTEIKEPTTLKEYHEQTIRDLWEKDRIRGEIIKILEEGSWIGDELSKKIKKEVSDAFFTYYDEKQGSLRMKAGRREKNKQINPGESFVRIDGEEMKIAKLGKNREKVVENLEIEGGAKTLREKRENLILQWYEKKLNRDELLRILEEEVIMDKESKKKIREEIIKDFYENYDKAKEEGGYQLADIENKEIKRTKKQLKAKISEWREKKEGREREMRMIDEEMENVSKEAMKLGKGSWLTKRRLDRAKSRRDELAKQERKIKEEFRKLEREGVELWLSLRSKEKRYGGEIDRSVWKPAKIGRKISKEEEEAELKEQTTLKGYKERYEKMIKDKEEYMKNFLGVVRDMDMGIGEEKKEEVLENMEENMKKEIEKLKEGDESTKMADEIEKWLKDNWKATMEKLIGKKKEIEEKDNQFKELEAKEKGGNITTDEVIQIRMEECKLAEKQVELEDEYKQIKADLQAKLEKYDGSYISEEEYVVETWKERKERQEREKKEREIEKTKEMFDPYRKLWKEKIILGDGTKERIIEVADKILVKVDTDADGSRLIEFKLEDKIYKILDPILDNHTSLSGDYSHSVKDSENLTQIRRQQVYSCGMMGNLRKWENEPLRDYVVEKIEGGLHLARKDELESLLKILGKTAGLDYTKAQMAMLMYLTGVDGAYWLFGENVYPDDGIFFEKQPHFEKCGDTWRLNLLMISVTDCKK